MTTKSYLDFDSDMDMDRQHSTAFAACPLSLPILRGQIVGASARGYNGGLFSVEQFFSATGDETRQITRHLFAGLGTLLSLLGFTTKS